MGVHGTQRCLVSQFAQETGAASLSTERTIAFRRGFGRKRFIGNAVKARSSSGSFNMRARAKMPSTAARNDRCVMTCLSTTASIHGSRPCRAEGRMMAVVRPRCVRFVTSPRLVPARREHFHLDRTMADLGRTGAPARYC